MGNLLGAVDVRKSDSGGLEYSVDKGVSWSSVGSGAGGGAVTTPCAVTLAAAQALLGSANITRVFGTDFDTDLYTDSTVAGTGAVALSTTENGGVMTIGTGALGQAQVFPNSKQLVLVNPTTARWFARFRAKITTAINADTTLAVGLLGITGFNPGFYVGVNGNRSTVNFSYDFYNNAGANAANGSLGVAIDTTDYHIFDILGDTTNFYIYIDSTLRATIPIPAAMTNPVTLYPNAAISIAAVNRQINVDYMFLCV